MPKRVEIPYGLQIAPDCACLEENDAEVRAMLAMLAGIVEDRPFAEIAASLNQRGWRMRSGAPWTQTAVFQLLPRLIEYSPELFSRPEWAGRPRSLARAGLRHLPGHLPAKF